MIGSGMYHYEVISRFKGWGQLAMSSFSLYCLAFTLLFHFLSWHACCVHNEFRQNLANNYTNLRNSNHLNSIVVVLFLSHTTEHDKARQDTVTSARQGKCPLVLKTIVFR